jgi:hypothetical protein
MQQRLATGENHPAYRQTAKRFTVPLEIAVLDFNAVLAFPDVTHHTATVAAAVYVQD